MTARNRRAYGVAAPLQEFAAGLRALYEVDRLLGRIHQTPGAELPESAVVAVVFRVAGHETASDGVTLTRLDRLDCHGEVRQPHALVADLGDADAWRLPSPSTLDEIAFLATDFDGQEQ